MMRGICSVLLVLAIAACGPGDTEPPNPTSFRMAGWFEAHLLLTANGGVIHDKGIDFAVFHTPTGAHSFFGALCESNRDSDGLDCVYEYTDYSWGPDLTMDVWVDGWVRPPDAHIDMWWQVVEEFHRSYDFSEIERIHL